MTLPPLSSGQTSIYRTSGPRPWHGLRQERSTSTIGHEIGYLGRQHRDIHPNPTTFQELRDIYLTKPAH